MQKKISILGGILAVLFCVLIGCSQEKKQEESLLLLDPEETTAEAMEEQSLSKTAQESTELEDSTVSEGTGNVSRPEQEQKGKCIIHICGEVQNPGVYTLEEDSRIYQAVLAAGGFTEEAAENYLNQAGVLTDGMKIYVPSLEEAEQLKAEQNESLQVIEESRTGAEGSENGIAESGMTKQQNQGLVDINLADEKLLGTLPGIGSSKAKSIITYRQNNGNYTCIEDIMKVAGIKQGLFEKIRDRITVGDCDGKESFSSR